MKKFVTEDEACNGALWYHRRMAMTLRLPSELDAYLHLIAEEDHRSLNQTIIVALERYISDRWTEEILNDPVAMRHLAEADQDVKAGRVMHGADSVRALIEQRKEREQQRPSRVRRAPRGSAVV